MQSPTALTIKDSIDDLYDDEETQLQDEDDEDLEVVRPTDKWQTLKPGGYITMDCLSYAVAYHND